MKSKMPRKLFPLLLLLPCHPLSVFYVDDEIEGNAAVELVLSPVNPYSECIGYSTDIAQLVQVGPLKSVEMSQPIFRLVYRGLLE